jgi:hypothetical protein
VKALVDTSVWSNVFRRNIITLKDIEKKLTALILNNDALIIGPIRQEVLSGYSDPKKFKTLRDKLEAFPNLEIEDEDYITAADFSNQCRKKGIQGGHTDFLICAVAHRNQIPIFSTDPDFPRYAKIVGIHLY